jgi:hypothetical protein
MTSGGLYHSMEEFESTYFPNWSKNEKQQKKQVEPQKVGNNLALELLNLLK